MTTRREFIQAGLAATAATSVLSARTAWASASPFYKVLFDRRFSAGVDFAVEARRLGAPVTALSGTATDFWYADLARVWKKSPVAVAGLTTCGPLFGLEMVARDAGLQLVFRADHRIGADGRAAHEFFGSRSMRAEARNLGGGKTNWAPKAAQLVMRWPSITSSDTNISDARGRGHGPDTLTTWIIAPVRRG